MAKKILSVILAVVMIAALCTVAFAAEDSATITVAGVTKTIPVGETFMIQKEVVLPADCSVNSGWLFLNYDNTVVRPVYMVEAKEQYATCGLGDATKTAEPQQDGTGMSFAAASSSFSFDNLLEDHNLVTLKFEVIGAGTTTFTEDFGLDAFFKSDRSTIVHIFAKNAPVAGAEELAATFTQQTNFIYEGEPEPTEPPTDEPTEAPTDKPTEAPTDKPTEAPTQAPTDKPATVDDLKGLVAEAGKLDSGKYSKEDWQKVQDAIKAAQAIIADPNATPEQIAEAYAKLAAAMGKTTSTETTVAPTKKPSKSDTPKTGEAATSVFVLLAVLVMAAGVVIVARKRATK